ncbi:hypothetical protein EVAR_6532_1 [Eumeta japonica]|uniref:Uncharacterized protein n=1 Tax=Eumeta variegata TaxID=151549 RepID=A0A4C1SSL8_EUMVA|nr:hypothetical protein EVAR_6532_1 [Eumeta japonica]
MRVPECTCRIASGMQTSCESQPWCSGEINGAPALSLPAPARPPGPGRIYLSENIEFALDNVIGPLLCKEMMENDTLAVSFFYIVWITVNDVFEKTHDPIYEASLRRGLVT